jgi:hypothetical protein
MATVQRGGILSPRLGRGQTVVSRAKHTVVFLYEHALLGEGIAKYLRDAIGIQAKLVSAHDPIAVSNALALGPEVVIFESNHPLEQFGLDTIVPNAVLIDLSTVITRGSTLTPCVAGLEQILQAIRESSSTIAVPSKSRRVGTSASPAR